MKWGLYPALPEANVIYSYGRYVIVVTPVSWMTMANENNRDLSCYSVMNTEHETIESTANNLPIAYAAAQALEDNLVLQLNKSRDKETKDALSVVSFPKDGSK